jgi:hypothetical protein
VATTCDDMQQGDLLCAGSFDLALFRICAWKATVWCITDRKAQLGQCFSVVLRLVHLIRRCDLLF